MRTTHPFQVLLRGGNGQFARRAKLAALARYWGKIYGIDSTARLKGLKHREGWAMASDAEKGIVSIASHHSVGETVEKVKQMLAAKGVKLFAVVDHSGEAEKAGLHMRNTKLLIFGNPKAGTPMMVAVPSIAIDLPLKLLIAEDEAGRVWISYNAPAYIKERHRLPEDISRAYGSAGVDLLAAKAAE